jgi:hypothetical protein
MADLVKARVIGLCGSPRLYAALAKLSGRNIKKWLEILRNGNVGRHNNPELRAIEDDAIRGGKFACMRLTALNMLSFHFGTYRQVARWDCGEPPMSPRQIERGVMEPHAAA